MKEVNLTWLDPSDANAPFPSPEDALDYPEGLVAAGGDLNHVRLLRAYRKGIFPWYERQQPILWWSPDPRGILYPRNFAIHRSLKRTLSKYVWNITYDKAFKQVIEACAEPRSYTRSTWITPDMIDAYCHLHQLKHAHSVEVWEQNELVGGIYGIAMGRIFFGESMFSRVNDASKVALLFLSAFLDTWGYEVIDTQLPSAHLSSLGGTEISRVEYLQLLHNLVDDEADDAAWVPGQTIELEEWTARRNSD